MHLSRFTTNTYRKLLFAGATHAGQSRLRERIHHHHHLSRETSTAGQRPPPKFGGAKRIRVTLKTPVVRNCYYGNFALWLTVLF
jgi:hypothetical protein